MLTVAEGRNDANRIGFLFAEDRKRVGNDKDGEGYITLMRSIRLLR
ncbi:hypothetical protein ACFS7Z_04820 [Pontibacter toksunensis]|uniref:Uncharacterized protein n=1 Tax=Pontibacter toksunensis TaxID=1332631 RepID=A0ABW6BQ15_9BACT